MTAPYYADDLVTLYLGDCRDVDAWLAADVLVTDPPYGIEWEQRAYLTRGRSGGQWATPHAGIANDADVSMRDAALSAWGPKPGLVFGAIDRPFPARCRRVLVWKKPADSGLFGSIGWRKDWEPIFMVGSWPASPATDSSIVTTAAGSHRQYAQGVHPHAKPLDTLQKLISKCPLGTVADPFAGSGSTLVAAKALGRRSVGVEVDERYCEIAAKRSQQGVLDFGGAA